MESEPSLPNAFGVAIVGDFPGAGATRITNDLSEHWNIKKLSAGDFRRAIAAFVFSLFQESGTALPVEKLQFAQQLLTTLLQQGGMSRVHQWLSENQWYKRRADNPTLLGFNAMVQKDLTTGAFWDILTDRYITYLVFSHLLKGESVVFEGDLAIAGRRTDQLKEEVERATQQSPFIEKLIFEFLLHVDPSVGAARARLREAEIATTKGVPVSYASDEDALLILKQMLLQDEARYRQIYTVNGKPLARMALTRKLGKKIDATHKTPEEVKKIIQLNVERVIASLKKIYPLFNPVISP